MSGAAKDVADFVADEFFDPGASGAEEFAGIEFFGVLGENFADSGGHRKAKISVDVYFGAANAAGDFDVGFGDAGGIGAHCAAIFVDVFDEFFGDAGSAVKDERVIAQTGIQQSFLNCFEPFEIEVLFAFKFVSAMRVADGDGE